MSIVSYGDDNTKVTLPYAMTTQFNQEAMYDDMGGTDWYCTKFDIKVRALLNIDYLGIIAPDLAGAAVTSSAELMSIIRSRLLHPRKTLSFKFNSIELIPKPAGVTGTVDAQNGPKPQSCSISQLTNTSFLIDYHIIANYWENNTNTNKGGKLSINNNPGNNVLYNRWSESIDVNELNLTTRTRSGKFLIRSDNVNGKIADEVIVQMAVVGVPPEFLRKSSHYTVTPDGLAIEYQVVDQEQYKMPPKPAFKATGYYREIAKKAMGRVYGEVSVKLEGDKNTSQSELIEKALIVSMGKIKQRKGTGFTWFLMEEAAVTIGLYENYVECRLRVMGAPTKNRVAKTRGKGLFD